MVDKSNKSLDDPAYSRMAQRMMQLASAGQKYRDYPFADRFGQWPDMPISHLDSETLRQFLTPGRGPGEIVPGEQFVDPLGYRGQWDPATGFNLLRRMQAGGRIEGGRDPGRPPYRGVEHSRIVPGNIDLTNRPVVRNPDGSISTVRSMSFGTDQGHVLVPTVSDDGRIMSSDEAIDTYRRTGRHLGIFSSPDAATDYARQLHLQQEQMYSPRDPQPSVR